MNQATIPIFRLLPILPLAVSAAVHAYDVVPVSGGGAIEGKVVCQGSVPVRKIIPTKDKEVCGSTPRDEVLMRIGPDKGVEDAVVYLKEVAKGKAWGKPDKTPALDQEHCTFKPA